MTSVLPLPCQTPALTPALQDGPGKELLSALIQVMEREEESELGVQEQMVELLRTLLEPDQAEAHKPGSGGEGSGFLDLFYDKHVGRLVATLGKAGEGLSLPPSTLCLIVELLTFCAQHHG